MFCEKCGSILIIKDKGGKKIFFCKNCGAEYEIKEELKIRSKIEERPKILEKSEEETQQKVEATCPKCGNKEAYFWVIQTRAADEPPTRFYRCTKCGHTWREYT